MIFAVITVSSVLVYDTQHPHPLARLGGLHLACINDATWSADGNALIVCSSDGYLSFITFDGKELGEPLPKDQWPEALKLSHPSIYGHPAADPNAIPPVSTTSSHTALTTTASPTPAPVAIKPKPVSLSTTVLGSAGAAVSGALDTEKKRKRIVLSAPQPLNSYTGPTTSHSVAAAAPSIATTSTAAASALPSVVDLTEDSPTDAPSAVGNININDSAPAPNMATPLKTLASSPPLASPVPLATTTDILEPTPAAPSISSPAQEAAKPKKRIVTTLLPPTPLSPLIQPPSTASDKVEKEVQMKESDLTLP